MTLEVLVVTKGHDFNHDSLLAMLGSFDGIEATLVQQPAAQVVLQPDYVSRYGAVLFYDMSGIPGIGLLHDDANNTGVPPATYINSINALLAAGTGMVLLNHATVSWPNWPLWRQITGSSFMLTEGELHGQRVPGSGYRGGHGPLPNATVMLAPDGTHPVLKGIEGGFAITDELYLKTSGYENNVQPILRGRYEFVQSNFTAPPLAPPEEQANWSHPPGSDLIVWANAAGKSPIIVSDVGDGPLAFDNPSYQTLIANSLRWVASAQGRRWAVDFSNAN